jgi:hypothetical protein
MTRTQTILVGAGMIAALLFSLTALYRVAERPSPTVWATRNGKPAPATYTDIGLRDWQRANPDYAPPLGPDYANAERERNVVPILIKLGGRRWQKFGLDRVYFGKYGAGDKVFFDVKTGEFTGPNTQEAAALISRLQAAIQ